MNYPKKSLGTLKPLSYLACPMTRTHSNSPSFVVITERGVSLLRQMMAHYQNQLIRWGMRGWATMLSLALPYLISLLRIRLTKFPWINNV